jgi:hypothetical protein
LADRRNKSVHFPIRPLPPASRASVTLGGVMARSAFASRRTPAATQPEFREWPRLQTASAEFGIPWRRGVGMVKLIGHRDRLRKNQKNGSVVVDGAIAIAL